MENILLTMFLIPFLPALFDFVIWYGLFKENDTHPSELGFRILKALFDYAVIPFIAWYFFQVSFIVLAAYVIAKWFHLCDSYYNIFRYIITNEPTEVWGYWRWWTPLGLLRTNFWGFCILPGFTKRDYDGEIGHWHPSPEAGYVGGFFYKQTGFSKGMVSIKEAWIQTFMGLIIGSYILLQWA